MAAGPGGRVFCAWIDLEGDRPRVCGSLSADGGATWKEPVVVEGDSDAICPCCHPSVAFDAEGNLAVAWRGVDGDARDLVLARSEDGAATFSKPARLGTGRWKVAACPMDGGSLLVHRGKVTAVWRREGEVYRGSPGAESLVGRGEQPWIAEGPEGPLVVWQNGRGGELRLLAPTAVEAVVLDEHATDPVIAASLSGEGPVVAAWESGTEGRARIVAARIGP